MAGLGPSRLASTARRGAPSPTRVRTPVPRPSPYCATPGLRVRLHEAPETDPTGGLRERRADLALTRLPFDTSGLTVRQLGWSPWWRRCPRTTRSPRHPGAVSYWPAARTPPISSRTQWRLLWPMPTVHERTTRSVRIRLPRPRWATLAPPVGVRTLRPSRVSKPPARPDP
ncbi:LysR substrate-binding domain-containing protein [Streptomyces sp. NPDC058746]|uniref:LysR substrate-binding domain-containing protein n=1 Tax=Streptomyces sp. NPDC058746 TaxID=3346622 RepID=UPI0036B647DF